MNRSVLSFALAFAVLAVLTACTATRRWTAPASASPIFQMRLVADAPSSESTEMSIIHQTESLPRKEVLYVQTAVLLDQTALKSAKVETDGLGHPQIAITFTEKGQQEFAEVTRQNIGKRLAIVIDGRLCSAPRIMTEIPGGKAIVSGNFSATEAEQLVAKINASLR
jgi:preprotein translocase subunit SecD